MPKMIPVKSSNIHAIGTEPGSKPGHSTLHVQFKRGDVGGDTHKYTDVPDERVADMIQSPSIGSFFSKHIRGVYKSEKL